MDEEKEIIEQVEEIENPRSINVIIHLPYSELTPEEIEAVIDFRAKAIARDEEHKARMQALNDAMKEKARKHEENARKSQELLESLTRHAIDRFMEVSENGQEK